MLVHEGFNVLCFKGAKAINEGTFVYGAKGLVKRIKEKQVLKEGPGRPKIMGHLAFCWGSL